MPFYVEFPTDPVVDVHWKKKDDGGDGGGDHEMGPCGMFGPAISAPYFGINRYLIQGFTLTGLGIGETRNSLYRVSQLWNDTTIPYGHIDDIYYWGGPQSFTVRLFPRQFPSSSTLGIGIYYTTASYNITGATELDEFHTGGGEATANIDMRKSMTGEAVFVLWRVTEYGNEAPTGTAFTVQGHCPMETAGAPPPQPPGNGWPDFPGYIYVFPPPVALIMPPHDQPSRQVLR